MTYAELLNQRMKQVEDTCSQFSCSHLQRSLRKRAIAGGHFQYVEQCVSCGLAASRALPKKDAYDACNGKEPPLFDDSIQAAWADARAAALRQVLKGYPNGREQARAEFFAEYDVYLQSAEWKEKSGLVIARAKGICEGCGVSRATQVHHLSYDHVYAEFLFELVAVCKTCHDRIHNNEVEAAAV